MKSLLSINRQFTRMGNLIKAKRIERELSQEQLSKILGYKNGQFISNVERGICSIPLNKAILTCKILDIMVKDFKQAYLADIDNNFEAIISQTNLKDEIQSLIDEEYEADIIRRLE